MSTTFYKFFEKVLILLYILFRPTFTMLLSLFINVNTFSAFIFIKSNLFLPKVVIPRLDEYNIISLKYSQVKNGKKFLAV